jgi:hypothetical protein
MNPDQHNNRMLLPLLENTGWKAANPGNLALEDAARDLARYTEQQFRDAFRTDQRQQVKDRLPVTLKPW